MHCSRNFFFFGGGGGGIIKFKIKINIFFFFHDFSIFVTIYPLVLYSFYFDFSFQVSFGEMIGCDNEEVCTILHWQAVHMYMLWFNFIPWLKSYFFCFKHYHVIIIHYHTQKQKKIKFEPRINLNHNTIYMCLSVISRVNFHHYKVPDYFTLASNKNNLLCNYLLSYQDITLTLFLLILVTKWWTQPFLTPTINSSTSVTFFNI